MQESLTQAIELAHNGQKQHARSILIAILQQDSNNVSAWKWLATVAASRTEAHQAITNILILNPHDAWAIRALDVLDARSEQHPPTRRRKRRKATIAIVASFGIAALALSAIAALSFFNRTTAGALFGSPNADNPAQQADALFTPDNSAALPGGPTLPPSWTPAAVAQLPSVTPLPTQTLITPLATSTQFPTRTPGFFDLESDQPPLILADGPISTTQAVIESQTIFFYSVTGSTADEINLSILDNGPKGAGQDAIAQIQYNTALQYSFEQSINACTPHEAAALLDMVFTYPEYVAPPGVSPSILAEWDGFFVRVVEHEEAHAQIARECAENLVTSFNQLAPTQTCRELQSNIEAIQIANDQACEDRQIAYDIVSGGDSFP